MKLNHNKYKIIYNNKKTEFGNVLIKKNNENIEVKIKIKILENITDISFMFYKCNLLKCIKHISTFNKIKNMSCLFYGCSSLEL